jgi:hypothetical protein
MYKIIGTDGKEYGPIDGEGLRTWISEGRAHSQSLVRKDGETQWQSLGTLPEFAWAAAPAPVAVGLPPPASGNETVATIIPYRNPQALVAYYLGLFSLFHVLGFFLAVVAVILGIRGLLFAGRNPQAKGKVHAWVGIICGGLFGLFNLLIIVAMFIGFAASRHQRTFGAPN